MIKKIMWFVLFIFSMLFIGTGNAMAETPSLKIDFDNMNGHAIVKIDEGGREVIKINLINAKGKIEYDIAGGADKELFQFYEENLTLSFKKIADFENPKDYNKDNIYRVSLNIEDDSKKMRQSFWIYIKNVDYPGAGNQDKKGGIRNLRNQESCKDTKSLNFNARGKHKQELCIYKAEIEILTKIFSSIPKTETVLKKTNETNETNNYKKDKKTTGVSITIKEDRQEDNTILAEAKTEENIDLKNDKSLENDNKGSQVPSKNSEPTQDTMESSSNLFFWILILVILGSGWILWKVIGKKDDKIDIDRL